jgi:hypothetical protein
MIIPLLIPVASAHVHAGANLYMRVVGRGRRRRATVYGSAGGSIFRGAFSLSDASVDQGSLKGGMTKGYVNGLEPVGPDGAVISQTTLDMQLPAGESWLCLKVQIDTETGRMTAKTQEDVSPENLSVSLYDSAKGGDMGGNAEFGYAPLAMIDTTRGIPSIYQIAYFSYRHSTARLRDQFGTRGTGFRHYFHVA